MPERNKINNGSPSPVGVEVEERRYFEALLAASDAVVAKCKDHPVPAPKPGSRIIPKGCTCYSSSPEWIAMMNYRSPVCNLCGGREKCKPDCEALDRQ